MLCAISGEAPEVPVVSTKSGNVFEKLLVEAYIAENGRDPVTGEELAVEDLIELKSSQIAKPRPPQLTSIPSLLSTFQNEWDALVLETYTLRQQLAQTRQELSTALYQNDAAIRMIARLTSERDESRDALSKISIRGGANGDSMQVDAPGLSEALIAKVSATHERLSKTRRKRPVPEDWATAEDIESLKPKVVAQAIAPNASCLAVNPDSDLSILGTADGTVGIFSVSKREIISTLRTTGAVTAAAWVETRAVVASKSGVVQIFEKGAEVEKFSEHAGAATGIAVHPSGALLASVGADKSFIFYNLDTGAVATKVFTDAALLSAAFHPDGHLFAAGGSDGQIKIFDVKSGDSAAEFSSSGPVQSIAFSENGTWLASVSKGQTSVQIWDLRKATQIKSLEIGGPISTIQWDYTGQYLLTAGSSGVSVQQYSKSTKEWTEPLKSSTVAIGANWGQNAASIVSLDQEGSITALD